MKQATQTQTPVRFHVEKPPSAIALDRNPSKQNVVACLPERNRELVKDPVREKQHWLTVRHQYWLTVRQQYDHYSPFWQYALLATSLPWWRE